MMIKAEMKKYGVSFGTDEVFEVEICEFGIDGDCLDSKELLFIGVNEEEAWNLYETTARQQVKGLNDARGGLQEDGSFFGLRLTRYVLEDNHEYQPIDGDDYLGEFEDLID